MAKLGTVEGGVRRIRVAYSTAEWQANRSGFSPSRSTRASASSVVIVFLTDRPLFDELRARWQESAAGFAEGLDAALPRERQDSVGGQAVYRIRAG